MNEPIKSFLLLYAALSALSLSRKLIRRLKLRYITNRRRRRLILLRLALIRSKRRNNNLPIIRRSWSWNRPQYVFDDLLAGRLPDDMWKEHLRVNKRTFERICQIVSPELSKRDTLLRRAIPVQKRVAIALTRLATGNSYLSSGVSYGLPKSTSNGINKEFCAILRRKAAQFIKFPTTEDETREAIEDFEEIGIFPQVVGAVDGSHIEIKAPTVNRKDYVCRKGYPSMLLQGVVNSKGKFIHVSTGYPGSIHDARILRMSSLYRDIDNGKVLCTPTKVINGKTIKPLLLGDPAYRLTTWLIKPYTLTARLTESQKLFNRNLSSLRVVVEQAFGKLKGRWRCLATYMNEDVTTIPTTIIACCVLHNICTDMAVDTPIAIFDDGGNQRAAPVAGHDINSDGRALREHLRRYIESC